MLSLLSTDFESNKKFEIIWLNYNKNIQYPAGVFDYARNLKYADLINYRCVDMTSSGSKDAETLIR